MPHTADLRIEAWAATREGCVAEAVLGTVESFLDTTSVRPERTHHVRLSGLSDEDLLVAVLDEVVYLLDAEGQVPVDVVLEPRGTDVDVRFGVCDTSDLPQIGALPKAVSLHELSMVSGPGGWRCTVTLDV